MKLSREEIDKLSERELLEAIKNNEKAIKKLKMEIAGINRRKFQTVFNRDY